jgi:hypothetical protein|tara:strand:+ start:45 stop:710 length:666 start_codon:yes stop_codon:yes gene_type:complete
MAKKFSTDDAKYNEKPKSALPKKPGEPDQYDNHNYKDREVRPDGSTVYYYENGVKAIHHPKKNTTPDYHKSAARHHLDETSNSIDSAKYKEALAHLKALSGHSQALDKFRGDGSSVEKLAKEFSGTVAVASDPAVFTPTYSGNNKKGKSGVKKLDDYLKKATSKSIVTLINDVRKEFQKEDNQIDTENMIDSEVDKALEMMQDDSVDFFENLEYDEEEADE